MDEQNGSPLGGVEAALADKYQVEHCEAIMLDTYDDNLRGGREVEFGMALALGKLLVVVGPKRNLFHSLAHYRFEDWKDAVSWLRWHTEHI